ncbi:NAD(P)-dependent dehydrogenase (short-subunit alcohol dehydrogenase family) [Actinoplanes campanulatus]|uniref:NAD(P)-dependent dehydrogenase (Short-subunit alcohol dehydrogenase family) n=1 Tax=Actinoplanes campanulatus TaxID=113559 RepID=A0A7W5AFX9_9ACTN|nr:SDR family oxidoreductase [Actinoplanes campanulatus]MBB3095069.1 NAD(P)-dependent dehydrogenase (short-subunit alcohol dehydrogenase family) [Actinoplanes campanulatus]GGN23224.1 short chain dehydrogenase [Actinoplanes campanulatus]GID34673.1 short chain dehydrogenase [Actinoplanes campanulatus]
MDPLDFTGRAVVVTGGTRGIGAAVARAFQAAGAHVLVCARTTPSSGLPGIPAFFPADVRDPVQAAALVAEAVRRFGRLDVLINNAGGAPTASADTASPRLHAKVIELNLIAPLHVSQAANTVMREQATGGVILMIGSVSGTRPSPGTAAYGAAKAGLHHLATSLAAEWAPKVRVNSLVVGPVDSGAGPDQEAVARTVPMGRAASPGEVAGACLLLASPLAGYITGASLAVHGGGEWPAYLADLRDTAYRAEK